MGAEKLARKLIEYEDEPPGEPHYLEDQSRVEEPTGKAFVLPHRCRVHGSLTSRLQHGDRGRLRLCFSYAAGSWLLRDSWLALSLQLLHQYLSKQSLLGIGLPC